MSIIASPTEEALRIIDFAGKKGIVLRLFGGVAFFIRCPSAKHRSLQRNYVDVDLMGHSKQSRDIQKLFAELGYLPRDKFNMMQGHRRLIFNDVEHQRRVDIFLDVFEMCHRFNFKDRMELDKLTIPLSDLLVTKLQIVNVNEKDLNDMTSLFLDFEVGKEDGVMLNGAYIGKLCGSDWGVYRTFTMNIDRLLARVEHLGLEEIEKERISERLSKLRVMIEETPKTLGWRMRASVGDRVKWYELPEADKEVVDSRIEGPQIN